MVNLPCEIWMEITSYLPRETIWSLRYLNSCLFNIALDDRYNFIYVSMESLHSRQYAQKFLLFRDKNRAKRIRNVIFFPSIRTTFPGETMLSLGYIKRMQAFLNSPQRSVIKTIQGFSDASSLEYQSLGYQQKIIQKGIPTFNATLRTCFSRLTSLVIQVAIPLFAELLQPDLFLPHLASLALGCPGNYIVLSSNIAPTIVPFVNRHRLTLTTFSLQLGTDTDGSSPFVALDHIPALKTLYIFISQSNDHGPISRFLELHSTTLQKINIAALESSGAFRFIAKIFSGVTSPFPNLREFGIQNPGIYFPPDLEYNLEDTADFIRRCSSSLVKLGVQNAPQTKDGLFDLFRHQDLTESSYANLRTLYIDFWILTPKILDFLASRLLNLHQLHINTAKLKPRETVQDDPSDQEQFCFQMLRRNYVHWKLEEFYFSLIELMPTHPAIGAAAMAIAMTSLRYFDNTPVAEYISKGPLAELASGGRTDDA